MKACCRIDPQQNRGAVAQHHDAVGVNTAALLVLCVGLFDLRHAGKFSLYAPASPPSLNNATQYLSYSMACIFSRVSSCLK
jgi:hypothetical protein